MERCERIFLFINREKERVREVGREVALALLDEGRRVVAAPATCDFLQITDLPGVEAGEPPAHADLAVVLGGDGTLLSAVAAFAPAGIPMLGVNLGTLGFLTAVGPRHAAEAFRAVFSGDATPVRELPLVQAALLRGGTRTGLFPALNDIVVGRNPAAHVNVLDLYADDRFVDTLIGDGAVIATALGSTGYALSCGGPVVAPGLDCLVVAPVASHTLGARPLIFPAGCRITLRVKSGHGEGILSVDGQVHLNLRDDDAIVVTLSDLRAKLVEPLPGDFFSTLRDKLNFGAGGRAR